MSNELIRDQLKKMRDQAYCDFIAKMRTTECLGWEAKVRAGEFGEKELMAHCAGHELLGKHVAFNAALNLIDDMSSAFPESEATDQLAGWLHLCKEYSCNQTPEALGACFTRMKERLEDQIKTLQERLSDQTQRANQFGREAREGVPAKIAPISIDSAPTDGTSILGWSEEYGWRETRKHQYLPNSIAYMNGERFGGWEWLEEVHNSLHTWKPTHWLPLPDNPNPDPRKARIVERIQRGGGAEAIAQWILDNELVGLSAEGKVER